MREKALLSHSGRLAFSLPNSPNETSFTHLVDDAEDFNKAPFASSRSPGEVAAPSYYYFWGEVEAMAPERQRDSVPNRVVFFLPPS